MLFTVLYTHNISIYLIFALSLSLYIHIHVLVDIRDMNDPLLWG